jgi:hypothetical protein
MPAANHSFGVPLKIDPGRAEFRQQFGWKVHLIDGRTLAGADLGAHGLAHILVADISLANRVA